MSSNNPRLIKHLLQYDSTKHFSIINSQRETLNSEIHKIKTFLKDKKHIQSDEHYLEINNHKITISLRVVFIDNTTTNTTMVIDTFDKFMEYYKTYFL